MSTKHTLAKTLMIVGMVALAGCQAQSESSATKPLEIAIDNGSPATQYTLDTSTGDMAAYPGSSKFATVKMGVYEGEKQTELCEVKLAYDYYMSSTGMNNTGKNTQMDETAGRTVEDIVNNGELGKADVYPATINLGSTGQIDNNLTFTIMKHDDLNISGVKEMYPDGHDVTNESGLNGYLRYSQDNSSAVLVVEINENWSLGIQNTGKNITEMSAENLANALISLVSTN